MQRVNQMTAGLKLICGEACSSFFLITEASTTLGHDCGNMIVLGDPYFSSKRAKITFEEGNYWIEDIESRFGIYLNGERISHREKLVDRSLIRLGLTIFRFQNLN